MLRPLDRLKTFYNELWVRSAHTIYTLYYIPVPRGFWNAIIHSTKEFQYLSENREHRVNPAEMTVIKIIITLMHRCNNCAFTIEKKKCLNKNPTIGIWEFFLTKSFWLTTRNWWILWFQTWRKFSREICAETRLFD